MSAMDEGHKAKREVELKLYYAQGGKCFAPWCSIPLRMPDTESEGAEYHLDHYIPRAKGGLDLSCNLDLLCAECNLEKSDKWPSEWCKAKGWQYMPAPPLFAYACADRAPAEQFFQMMMDELTERATAGAVNISGLPPEIYQSIAMVTSVAREQARDEIMRWNTPDRVENPAYIHAVRTRTAADLVVGWLEAQSYDGVDSPE